MLPRVYPWLKAVHWALWITSVALIAVSVLSDARRKPYLRLWLLSWGVYGGLMLVKTWVGRRVEPEAYTQQGRHGWWPTAKTP